MAIREQFGKFDSVLEPGCHCLPWIFGKRVVGHLTLRLQQLDVLCETKTKDYHFILIPSYKMDALVTFISKENGAIVFVPTEISKFNVASYSRSLWAVNHLNPCLNKHCFSCYLLCKMSGTES